MSDMTFASPELEAQFRSALQSIGEFASVELFDEEVDSSFELSGFPDKNVEPSTEIRFTLVRSEPVTITVADLISAMSELASDSLEFDGLVYFSPTRTIVGLMGADSRAQHLTEKLEEGSTLHFATTAAHEDSNVTIGLTRGSVAFAMAVVNKDLFWDKYYPPYEADSLFVEVRTSTSLERDAALDLAHAYLFELGSTLDLRFTLSPRAEDADYPDDDDSDNAGHLHARLRPLLIGPGLGPLLREYQTALSAQDHNNAVLGFTKCIEYVSASVVRGRQYEDIRRRLMTPAAMDPSAPFIDGLLALVEENRLFTKDHEALRLTVERCCDAHFLAQHAPQHIASLRGLKADAKASDRKVALNELAACLSATRNKIAHAKANYDSTGQECPEEQMSDMAHCSRLAAEQCIRWYGDLSPSFRRR